MPAPHAVILRGALLVAAFSPQLPAQSGATGAIQGSIVDDTGAPVAGAMVIARPYARSGGMNHSAISAAGGGYSLNSLPAGAYTVCIQVPRGGYLDPCQWSQHDIIVTAVAGRTLTGYRLRTRRGSVLRVRVNDPGGHLDRAVPGKPAGLILGVRLGASPLRPLRMASADAGGRNYEVTIPINTEVNLSVAGRRLQLSDARGPLNASGASIAVKHPTAAANPTVTLNITGRTN